MGAEERSRLQGKSYPRVRGKSKLIGSEMRAGRIHREHRRPGRGRVPLRRRQRAISQDRLDSAVETNSSRCQRLTQQEFNLDCTLPVHRGSARMAPRALGPGELRPTEASPWQVLPQSQRQGKEIQPTAHQLLRLLRSGDT